MSWLIPMSEVYSRSQGLTKSVMTYPAAKTINPNLIDEARKLTKKAMT
jgi:hypothetical protein